MKTALLFLWTGFWFAVAVMAPAIGAVDFGLRGEDVIPASAVLVFIGLYPLACLIRCQGKESSK